MLEEKKEVILYEIVALTKEKFQLRIPLTGEIREAKSVQILLRSIAKDHGFYLRKI